MTVMLNRKWVAYYLVAYDHLVHTNVSYASKIENINGMTCAVGKPIGIHLLRHDEQCFVAEEIYCDALHSC